MGKTATVSMFSDLGDAELHEILLRLRVQDVARTAQVRRGPGSGSTRQCVDLLICLLHTGLPCSGQGSRP